MQFTQEVCTTCVSTSSLQFLPTQTFVFFQFSEQNCLFSCFSQNWPISSYGLRESSRTVQSSVSRIQELAGKSLNENCTASKFYVPKSWQRPCQQALTGSQHSRSRIVTYKLCNYQAPLFPHLYKRKWSSHKAAMSQ